MTPEALNTQTETIKEEYPYLTPSQMEENHRKMEESKRGIDALGESRRVVEELRAANPRKHSIDLPQPEAILEESSRRLNELRFKNMHYNAEEVVTMYGALSTYLTILAQQPEKDLETIQRVTRLMITIKPQAVEASQEIAGRNNNA